MESAKGYRYLKFITYLQIIGIILVVLGHSFNQYPDGMYGQSEWLLRLLYNVRMPLFTFVSGYLMYYTSFADGRQGRSWGDFTVNKVKRLLIPYLTLTLVTFIPRAALSALADDPVEMSFTSFVRSLFDPEHLVIPYFWFIQMSFILLVVTYAVLVICKRYKIRLEIAIFSLLAILVILQLYGIQFPTFFSINRVVSLGAYFVLGIATCHYSSWIEEHFHLTNIFVTIGSAVVWICLFYFCEGTPVTYISSVFGIISFVSLCYILDDRDIRVLDHLQGANYIIFLLSWYVNIAAQQVLAHFVVLPWWIHTIISLIGGVYIPWLGLKYLERHSQSRWIRFTAFLLGQKLNRPSRKKSIY